MFAEKSRKFEFSTQGRGFATFVGNGTKVKIPSEIKPPLKDLEGIIPSCTGEKLLCANEIEELLGVQTRKFNLTSKFSSAPVANVTEPKGSSLLTFTKVLVNSDKYTDLEHTLWHCG